MGKYVFERHFDSKNQKIAILAPLMDCQDLVRQNCFRATKYTQCMVLDSFLWMSLSISSTVKQKVDKIDSLLTCWNYPYMALIDNC